MGYKYPIFLFISVLNLPMPSISVAPYFHLLPIQTSRPLILSTTPNSPGLPKLRTWNAKLILFPQNLPFSPNLGSWHPHPLSSLNQGPVLLHLPPLQSQQSPAALSSGTLLNSIPCSKGPRLCLNSVPQHFLPGPLLWLSLIFPGVFQIQSPDPS